MLLLMVISLVPAPLVRNTYGVNSTAAKLAYYYDNNKLAPGRFMRSYFCSPHLFPR